MSDQHADEYQRRLKGLQEDYLSRLPDKVRSIVVEWSFLKDEDWDAARLESLYRMIHSIAGSATTFGLARVGEVARELQELLRLARSEGFEPTKQYLEEVQSSVLKLVSVSRDTRTTVLSVFPVEAKRPVSEIPLVYLAETSESLATVIAKQLQHFGYVVRSFDCFDGLERALREQTPLALVLDVELPDGSSPDRLMQLSKEVVKGIPVIFISSHEDFVFRLAAVRAGAEAYLTKPLDVQALIDVLDRGAGRREEEIYRILIVDDSVTLANFYKLTLEEAGMVCRVVTNPLDALDHMRDFNPDLVLTDMYMPECTGAELAKVIRQFAVFLSVPIVYLSAEKSLERQQEAMSLGGDDFLTKPIQPEHLVSAVSSRVQRARVLRSIMYRDSLTGLLNHTESKKQLDMLLSRAKRTQSPLVLAMVDIDHFKSVNDTYGHPMGDRVIRSLSLLLQQRLRKTDVVGRYGGEEFVAILPDTSLDAALNVLDQVRAAFSKVDYQAPQGEFNASFSCGLAAFPDFATLDDLIEQADQALYQAKKGGRNRACCSRSGA